MTTAQRLLTADDLLAMPDDGNRHELFRGELITMPPPGFMHSIVTGNFGLQIGSFVLHNGLPYIGGFAPPITRFMPESASSALRRTVATSPAWFPSWW